MEALLTTLADWKPFNAIVVGDFMLDQQLYGNANRLSPDAPVPVLHVTKQENQPGGAANLCLDLHAMHGNVTAIGVVGDDQEASILTNALTEQGVRSSSIVQDPSRPTTVKRNLIGLAQGRHAQKMFRVDFESSAPIAKTIEDLLLKQLDACLADADFVCIEDYNKGVCTPALCQAIIKRAKAAGKPVYVDPAPIKDYSKYAGATAITPNRTEGELATELDQNDDGNINNAAIARDLLTRFDFDAVVLTLDKHGAILDRSDVNEAVSIPTQARAVYDVTGAGDMMLAGLAAARANGLDWVDSVKLANAAAGLEVEIFGVAPIPIEQIHHELLSLSAQANGRTRTLNEAVVMTKAAKNTGKTVVFTNGCFDVIHAGHISLLQRAAALGDVLIVAMNDDHSVRGLKGPTRPVNDQENRARVLGALECVDAVVLFNDETPIKLIESINPDILVKGGDYSVETVVGADFVLSQGGRVELLDLIDGLSSTSTIERMKQS
ncbi:MAG: D-glycero-beta-D-manno-heptose 1-phosphate adenylyltransferase [Phycisphaerales bacterium]|nr:D-glycero-beta-D-manno-heptose 1-phosphate adenylyltransferase [Phycisphaerales bacterium]